jgi:hypothetical protein
MGKLLNQLAAFYKRVEWPMTPVSGEEILYTRYSGTNGEWVFVASADDSTGVITIFSRAPFDCPPERIGELSEFLERINFGITHGAWVLDRRDGEIRFRVGADSAGMDLSDQLLQRITLFCVTAMDTYLGALRQVIDGKSAREMLKQLFPDEV